MLIRAFFVLSITWCVGWAQVDDSQVSATPHYVETGDCPGEQLCSYSYSAQQQYQDDGEDHKTMVNATVEVMCTSSGVYGGSEAKLYCMTIKNAKLMSYSLANSSTEDINNIRHSLNSMLENWFCFVQSSSGKVPAVFHSPSEPDHVVSFKKAIAAAFQANFEGTEEEEETDPQSHHRSHYTYDQTTEEGVKKMHRTVRTEDVSEYSTEKPTDEIETATDENIEYRHGRLEKSSGNTSFHLVNKTNPDMNSSFPLNQAFAGSGSYSMDLKSCRKVNKYVMSAHKKKTLSEMTNSKKEGLAATRNEEREAYYQMKVLRSKLPGGSALQALESYQFFGDKLFIMLSTLIKLEAKYGALTLHTPVIDDIMNFLPRLPELVSEPDRKLKEAILTLLVQEGSLRSQMALLNAYDNAADLTEANTILTHISFLKSVRIGLIIALEDRLTRPIANQEIAAQLMLVFASLATKGSDEVEDRVMSYLTARVQEQSTQETSKRDSILTLRALGNTGSQLSIPFIFSILESYVDHADYHEIELAVIDSLVKLTDDPIVLEKLQELLDEDVSTDSVFTTIDMLIDALDYVKESSQDTAEYISFIKSQSLIFTLAERVASSNNTDLHVEMEHYLVLIKADNELFAMIYSDSGPLVRKRRQATTDWDSTSSGDYNLVASHSNRQNDVSTYQHHAAYLNSHTLGWDQANAKIAYGFFAGAGGDCDRAKAFARGRVDLYLLGRTETLADAKVEVRATTTSVYADAYARVAGNTYFNYAYSASLSNPCYLYTRNLAEFRQSRSWSFNHYVYVGYVTLTVSIEVFLTLDANFNMCIGRTGTEVTGALAALTPTAGLTLGGGVSATFLEVARGGVDLSGTLSYSLEPAVSVQGCQANCNLGLRLCFGVYESFPSRTIDLETWYQYRVWDSSCGWFGCFVWGDRNRYDPWSYTWNLGSQARSPVYQNCIGYLQPVCANGALTSPLFSY